LFFFNFSNFFQLFPPRFLTKHLVPCGQSPPPPWSVPYCDQASTLGDQKDFSTVLPKVSPSLLLPHLFLLFHTVGFPSLRSYAFTCSPPCLLTFVFFGQPLEGSFDSSLTLSFDYPFLTPLTCSRTSSMVNCLSFLLCGSPGRLFTSLTAQNVSRPPFYSHELLLPRVFPYKKGCPFFLDFSESPRYQVYPPSFFLLVEFKVFSREESVCPSSPPLFASITSRNFCCRFSLFPLQSFIPSPVPPLLWVSVLFFLDFLTVHKSYVID